MNRIVREHYPVEKLPEDLRAELAGRSTVTLTIDTETAPVREDAEASQSWKRLLERVEQLRRSGVIKPVTQEEAVARVRALRDEWDS